jgi:hypothetical protein
LRDRLEVEALLTDRYLDALLAAQDRRASDAPTPAELDPAVRDAARRLGRDLARVHPSFRFEERLAARLAGVAASMRLPAAAGGEGVPLRALPAGLPDPLLGDPLLGDPLVDDAFAPGPVQRDVRPLLIGGALTSAALSLAGAAYVAWRRTRPPGSPMARAVRAARHARLAVRAPLVPPRLFPGSRRRLD